MDCEDSSIFEEVEKKCDIPVIVLSEEDGRRLQDAVRSVPGIEALCRIRAPSQQFFSPELVSFLPRKYGE